MTLAAYAAAGILTSASLPLIAAVVPSLALGVPLGAYLLRNVDAATFRRVCMSLDAWLVAFGLASVLRLLNVLDLTAAAALFAGVAAGDIWLWLRRRWWHQPAVYVVEPSRATFAVPSAAKLFSKRYVP